MAHCPFRSKSSGIILSSAPTLDSLLSQIRLLKRGGEWNMAKPSWRRNLSLSSSLSLPPSSYFNLLLVYYYYFFFHSTYNNPFFIFIIIIMYMIIDNTNDGQPLPRVLSTDGPTQCFAQNIFIQGTATLFAVAPLSPSTISQPQHTRDDNQQWGIVEDEPDP